MTTADEIVEAISPLIAHYRGAWARGCQAHGISLVAFQVLALLERDGPMPMSRLAEEIGVALPNATGIVGRLAQRGIVARDHDLTDRRVVRVALTESGRALVADMERTRRDRIRGLVGQLDAEAQRRLLRSMRDVAEAAARLRDPVAVAMDADG